MEHQDIFRIPVGMPLRQPHQSFLKFEDTLAILVFQSLDRGVESEQHHIGLTRLNTIPTPFQANPTLGFGVQDGTHRHQTAFTALQRRPVGRLEGGDALNHTNSDGFTTAGGRKQKDGQEHGEPVHEDHLFTP